MKPSKISVWLRLLWMFLKVNLLSPSGPASIGLLYKEAVGRIMSEERFVEAVGFSNVLPGSEALKLAMFVGYAAGGFPGVLAALLGAILPPTVMMLILAAVLGYFQQEDWLTAFVGGMSPAVAALMVTVAWELLRASRARKITRRALLIGALALIALLLEIPAPLVLIGAGILGVILFR